MCLYTKQLEPKIAEEDIEVSKILKKQNGRWVTPYRNYPVKFNEVMEAESIYTKEYLLNPYNYKIVYEYREITEGFFHSNNTDEVIKEFQIAHSREKKKCPEVKVFKAIIPKGSEYYVGVRTDICSTKLIILNE